MFGETTISYVKIGNHPIETTIYKWLFGVPGITPPKMTPYLNFEDTLQNQTPSFGEDFQAFLQFHGVEKGQYYASPMTETESKRQASASPGLARVPRQHVVNRVMEPLKKQIQ